jgi:hypothetical protein
MANTNIGVRDLSFELWQPEFLADERWDEIVALREDYYDRMLEGRSPAEARAFVAGTTRDSWNNPNDSALRGSYARALVAAAFDSHNRLVGFTYTADNASSNRHQPANFLERMAKLYNQRYLAGRYHWQRELVDNGDDRPGLREALQSCNMKGKTNQPMSIWIVNEEEDLYLEALAQGFRPNTNPRQQDMFGPDFPGTSITMYKADSVQGVFGHNMELSYAEPAISFALASLKHVTQ